MAFVDLRLRDESGLDLLETLTKLSPRLAVVIITAYASIDSAVDAMRRGAFDYLPKPFTPAQIRAILERFERVRSLQSQIADLQEQIGVEVPEFSLDSKDPQIRAVLEQGPAGSGDRRRRSDQGRERNRQRGVRAGDSRVEPARSCAVCHRELPEPECRPARKRAIRARPRLVSPAPSPKPKEKSPRPREGRCSSMRSVIYRSCSSPNCCGSSRRGATNASARTAHAASDVRLIAASNRDLDAAVAAGTFRDDLLFRLNVVEFSLPPLRARADRIDLAAHLLAFFARQIGKKIEGLTPEAQQAVLSYAWPGNLRELRNAIERAVIFAAGPLGRAERFARPRRHVGPATAGGRPNASIEVGSPVSLEQLEDRAHPALARALSQPRRRRPHSGNRSQHALPQAETNGALSHDRDQSQVRRRVGIVNLAMG